MNKIWEAAAHTESFVIGLDVGQQVDYSALAVVSRVDTAGDEVDPKTEMLHFTTEYQVRWLERPQLGTAFSTVVNRTVELRNDPALACLPHNPRIDPETALPVKVPPPVVLDGTGVGAPLIEMFQRYHGVRVAPIIITGGQEVNTAHGRYRVPKQDLIAALSVGFELQRVKIASGLDLSDDLLGELKNFRMNTKASSGHSTYDAKQGHHDDLLIAVALAVWWHEQRRRQTIGTAKIRGIY